MMTPDEKSLLPLRTIAMEISCDGINFMRLLPEDIDALLSREAARKT